MNPRSIGPFSVHPVGLGCMNLSHAYGVPPPADGEALLLRALDLGVTLFDTAALYGFGANETLVGRVLKSHRSRITLCSKGGMAGVKGDDGVKRRVIDGRPEAIRRNCEDSLQRLGTDVIDLYYLHRWDKQVPIEESVGAMARLVQRRQGACTGPVGGVGADHPPRPCRAPDHRGADRVFAVDPQPRDRGAAGLPRHRRRLRRLQPAGARLPDEHAARRVDPGRQGPAARHAALRARHLCPQPEAAAGLPGRGARRRLQPGRSWRWPGCWRRATTWW
jgi:hypothetical protein